MICLPRYAEVSGRSCVCHQQAASDQTPSKPCMPGHPCHQNLAHASACMRWSLSFEAESSDQTIYHVLWRSLCVDGAYVTSTMKHNGGGALLTTRLLCPSRSGAKDLASQSSHPYPHSELGHPTLKLTVNSGNTLHDLEQGEHRLLNPKFIASPGQSRQANGCDLTTYRSNLVGYTPTQCPQWHEDAELPRGCTSHLSLATLTDIDASQKCIPQDRFDRVSPNMCLDDPGCC